MMDRETEMMVCMKEQGFVDEVGGKFISFPIEYIIRMWNILIEDGEL